MEPSPVLQSVATAVAVAVSVVGALLAVSTPVLAGRVVDAIVEAAARQRIAA